MSRPPVKRGSDPRIFAKKLGVSRRTAYRDLQALEASVGVPVWNNLGRWGVFARRAAARAALQ